VTRARKTTLVAAFCLSLAACAEQPDLAPVQASLESGTAGLGANRVPDTVARGAFGQHVARAVMAEPAITRSTADIRAARADKRAADGAFRPDLSIGVNAQTRLDSNTNSDSGPFLRVSQLVYDAGAARSDQTAAEARVLQSRAQQIETGARVTLEAVEVYKRLLTSRRLLAIAEENLNVLRDFAGQIEERAERGAGSTADRLIAQSRVADAETQRVDAQAQLERAEAAFRRLFGEIPGNLPRPVKAPPLPADEADVLDQSPRLRAANATLKAAEADLMAASARRQPGVELGATGRRASGGGGDLALDLTLNYSLDTRGERRAAVDAAQARLDAAEAERETLLRDVREALAFVRTDQTAGEARVIAARQAVASNAASVDAAREQFSIGRRSMVDLLDAQRDYVRAEDTLIRAEQERFLTDYAALALTGDILDLFDITLPEVTP
jgi:adhesin transport system outer membrane protein